MEPKTYLNWLVNASMELIMAVLEFHIAFAQSSARPERREMRNATFERLVGNIEGCISMNSAIWRRKPSQSAASPT